MKKAKTESKQPVVETGSLKIEYRTLDSLIPYARTARTHSEEQIAQIAASIREFGFTNPILIDSKAIFASGIQAFQFLSGFVYACRGISEWNTADRELRAAPFHESTCRAHKEI
jgi:hypothetical protein